jgi:hypothetical protein
MDLYSARTASGPQTNALCRLDRTLAIWRSEIDHGRQEV